MANALTCPILDEPFTVDGIYRPYVLPCGHTISRQALEQVRQCFCMVCTAETKRDAHSTASREAHCSPCIACIPNPRHEHTMFLMRLICADTALKHAQMSYGYVRPAACIPARLQSQLRSG